MIYRERWRFRPDWLDYVVQNWTGIGRVQQVKGDSEVRLSFLDEATKTLKSLGAPARNVKTYISVQKPSSDDGYAPGYPHTHEPPAGVALVHYLQPGDLPAALDIFDGDKVVESITPEVGLTVVFANTILHGVKNHRGAQDRIQMIATGTPT